MNQLGDAPDQERAKAQAQLLWDQHKGVIAYDDETEESRAARYERNLRHWTHGNEVARGRVAKRDETEEERQARQATLKPDTEYSRGKSAVKPKPNETEEARVVRRMDFMTTKSQCTAVDSGRIARENETEEQRAARRLDWSAKEKK